MTREEWLQQLKAGDTVIPYIHNEPKEPEVLTHANNLWVTIGKYGRAIRFRRSDGAMCGRKRMGHLFRIEQP